VGRATSADEREDNVTRVDPRRSAAVVAAAVVSATADTERAGVEA
jgi:hypothetical protein